MSQEAKASPKSENAAESGAAVSALRATGPKEAGPTRTPTAAETVRLVRRRRARRLVLRMGLFVFVPTLLAAIYFSFLASDRYESVSLFTINASDRGGPALEGLIGIAAGAAPATRDTLAVRDFILSREMLADLEKRDGFIRHYKDASFDFWSRLANEASAEDAYQFYKDVVRVTFDSNSGVLTLKVQAYGADDAARFSKRILTRSEQMVNELAEKARADQMRFAQIEVDKAEKRLTTARQTLVELQKEYGEFNPEATAAAAMSIRTALEGELAKARAELAALKSYMSADAPQVIAANERVRSLAGQAAGETQRLVNKKGDGGLNASLAKFEEVIVEKEFATRAYQSALATLEIARTDATRQHRYLATIAPPSVADEAQYPRRFLGVLTVFLGSFLAYGIGSLLVGAVKEHARL